MEEGSPPAYTGVEAPPAKLCTWGWCEPAAAMGDAAGALGDCLPGLPCRAGAACGPVSSRLPAPLDGAAAGAGAAAALLGGTPWEAGGATRDACGVVVCTDGTTSRVESLGLADGAAARTPRARGTKTSSAVGGTATRLLPPPPTFSADAARAAAPPAERTAESRSGREVMRSLPSECSVTMAGELPLDELMLRLKLCPTTSGEPGANATDHRWRGGDTGLHDLLRPVSGGLLP
mmetsp:Transcript_367/g.1224  ORF Transcript_367/g.1224 Transcript_367/m.1224 type:complete len:234 (-) Transcript_367:264-965(-)